MLKWGKMEESQDKKKKDERKSGERTTIHNKCTHQFYCLLFLQEFVGSRAIVVCVLCRIYALDFFAFPLPMWHSIQVLVAEKKEPKWSRKQNKDIQIAKQRLNSHKKRSFIYIKNATNETSFRYRINLQRWIFSFDIGGACWSANVYVNMIVQYVTVFRFHTTKTKYHVFIAEIYLREIFIVITLCRSENRSEIYHQPKCFLMRWCQRRAIFYCIEESQVASYQINTECEWANERTNKRLETRHKHIKSYSANKSKALGMIYFFFFLLLSLTNGIWTKRNNDRNH